MNNKRTSTIILAKNINMDKEYSNIIDYSESDIVELCESSSHLVAKQNNYSFLKPNSNIINVGLPYETCLQANYIAMQNPYYNNKWFFAFINRVEYNSELSTNIYYTIDEISTWWDYWSKNKQSFVIREHVNDDTLGAHTIPEGLETGEYKIIDHADDGFNGDVTTIMATTRDPNDQVNVPMGVYNGITSGVGYYRYDKVLERWNIGHESETLEYAMNQLAGTSDAIVGLFLAPKWLMSDTNIPITPSTDPALKYIRIDRIAQLDGYTPKNNKMLTMPYCYIELSNACGQANTFMQERWSLNQNNQMTLVMQGCLTAGCSIRCYPYSYNGAIHNYDEGISLGKFPQLNWKTDHYTNWLTQNGISIGALKLDANQANIAKSAVQIGSGVASLSGVDWGATGVEGDLASSQALGGINSISSGVEGLWNNMQENYRHSLVPPTLHGSLNNGDVITASGINKFHIYKVTIKREFAESIDGYFTRYGYKVNSLKVPNFTGRTYWNYVKISNGEIIGTSTGTISIPDSSMDIINAVFRKGTTIWHNHDNIGNYSLDNTIVTP